MTKSHRRSSRSQSFHPLAFGGWHDYQTWADHDFVPRPADDVPEPDPESADDDVDLAPEDEDDEEEDELAPVNDEDYWATWPAGLPEEDHGPSTTMARPYVRTGGRASTTYDLRLETMLSTTRTGAVLPEDSAMNPDHRLICELCRTPTSVAEIAAHLRAPLGVARVLIGDALAANLLTLHDIARAADGRPTVELMRRVYDGLRRLA